MMPAPFHFGPFELSEAGLQRDGTPVPVSGRGLAVLNALSASDGVVSRDALLQAGWPGLFVEESNLTVQVASLRRAIGRRADGREWIVTVPRVGYRLLRERAAEDTAVDRVPAIAVLPFTNLTGDTSQDYFAEGVVEDIITALSRFHSFGVIARNSTFVYAGRAVDVREVSRELGADYILEGSLRRSGNRLRVAAQLLRGDDGAHLWARNFDGIVDDIFDVQDHISEEVVGIIEPRIQYAEIERSRRERPQSMAAYDLYLRALPRHAAMTPEDNAEAIALLDRAIELAPTFAPALKVASDARACRINFGWPALGPDDRVRCIELTERALECGGNDANVIAQASATIVHIHDDGERGVLLADRARELNPNNAEVLSCSAVTHVRAGSLTRAVEDALRALRLSPGDPLNEPFLLGVVSHAKLVQGDYEGAIEWAEHERAIRPRLDPSYWILACAYTALGRIEDARRIVSAFRDLRPNLTLGDLRRAQPSVHSDRMELIYAGLRAGGLPE